jgi:hypothetical protein
MSNPFTAHPNSAGQGYWQHFGFAIVVAGRVLVIAVIAAVHALFPFIAPTTAGDRLIALADEIKAARAKH